MIRKILFVAVVLFAFTCLHAQEGLVKSYYPNDTLKSVINYKKNIREGQAKFYFPNGNLKQELIYVNGKVDGLVKNYYESGKLKELFTIEDGKREGPTSLFKKDGTYLKDVNYKNGRLVIPKPKPKIEKTEVASKKKSKKELNTKKILTEKVKKSKAAQPPAPTREHSSSDPAYFMSADVMPEPVGGMKAIMDNIVYPEQAKENDIQGTVKVRVFIDRYGEVTHAEVVKGIGYGCDEAAKVALYYAQFKPGLIKGKPVKVQMVVPIEFKLKK